MTTISEKPSTYWNSTYSSIACGCICLALAAPLGALAAFSTGEFLILQASFSGIFGLAGTLFLVDAAVAKGRRFQQMRSAINSILPQGDNILDDNL